jgi:hypothetical protein
VRFFGYLNITTSYESFRKDRVRNGHHDNQPVDALIGIPVTGQGMQQPDSDHTAENSRYACVTLYLASNSHLQLSQVSIIRKREQYESINAFSFTTESTLFADSFT